MGFTDFLTDLRRIRKDSAVFKSYVIKKTTCIQTESSSKSIADPVTELPTGDSFKHFKLIYL